MKIMPLPHRFIQFILILGLLPFISLLLFVLPHPVHAAGEVTDCDGYESIGNGNRLQDMLAGGGLVTFNCNNAGDPATILINAAIQITQSTEINGGGVITLSGEAGTSGIFRLDSLDNVNFVVDSLKLINGVNSDSNQGGAIYFNALSGSTKILTITNSSFSGNTALVGGAIYAQDSNPIKQAAVWIENSTFDNNTAFGDGGGDGGAVLLNEINAAVIRNSTFYSNSAGVNSSGGAIAVQQNGNLSLINNTIVTNTASSGGAIALAFPSFNPLTVSFENNILAGNSSGTCDLTDIMTSTFGINFVTDSTCGDAFTITSTTDLDLGPLSDNGGQTATIPLLAASVAINAVPAGQCNVTADQRGIARPQNGFCDAGAFEVGNGANFEITKTVAPTGLILAGDTITYTISFSNTGVDPAAEVILTDIVPISVTVTNVTSSGVTITDTGVTPGFVWSIEDLDPGDSGLITITGQVSASLTPGTTFTNTATITTTSLVFGNNTAEVGVTIGSLTTSDVAITKTVTPAGPVGPGDAITYTLVFSNANTEPAANVVITDIIPAEVSITGVTSSGVTITDTGATPGFVWAVQDLAQNEGGTIILTGNISPNLTSDVIFTNTTTITTSTTDSNPANDSAAVSLVVNTPLLTITKAVTPDIDVAFQGEITYTVTLSNSGTGDANGVLLTDTLPVSTTFVRWVDQPAGAINSSSQITWTGTVTAGEALIFTFVVSHTGDYSDVVTNTAQYGHTNSAGTSNVVTFTVAGPPALTLAPTNLDFGNQAVGTTSAIQTVTLTNTGVSPLDISTITISGNFTQTSTCPASLATGATCTIDVAFAPTGVGPLSGTLTITTNAATSPDIVTLAGVGTLPGLTLTKAVTPQTNVAFHGEVTYTLTLSNTGLGDDSGVLLTDTLPVSTTFGRWLSQPPGANEAGNQITWSGTVTAGEAILFSFVVTHTGNYSDVVTNTAQYSGTTTSSASNVVTFTVIGPPAVTLSRTSVNFGNQTVGTTSTTRTVILTNTGLSPLDITNITISGDFSQTSNCPASLPGGSSCAIRVRFSPTISGPLTGTLTINTNALDTPHTVALSGVGVEPNLVISKSVTPQTNVAFQGEVTYTVILSNTGLGDASGVLLTDTLPLSTTFARWVNQPAGANEAGNLITWSGSVSSSQAITFRFVVTHTGGYGDVVTNTALFDHTSGSEVSNVATFTVVGPPAVTLVPAALNFGNQLIGTTSPTRTVTLTNTGGAPLDIIDITISGSFSQTNNCPAVLNSNNSCTIGVIFSPVGPGFVTGTLTVTSNAASSPNIVTLSGTGVFSPVLAISKSVTPQTNVPYRGEITYTVILSNSGLGDATGVFLTDTLPLSTTFARWIDQPVGANENGNQITWTGALSSGAVITFTFVASHTGNYSDTVVNTAQYSHTTSSSTAQVTFTVIGDTTPPTFSLPALITPTGGITVSTQQPIFDWVDAIDTESGVVGYTLVVTGFNGGTSFTVVTTQSTFTPGFSLANGDYVWTVRAFDAFNNTSSFVAPESFSIDFSGDLYLPLVLKNDAPLALPDLVIDDISVIDCENTTCTVRVVARNQSSTPVTFGNNFYVNVYQDGDIANPIIIFGVQASWFGAGQSRVLEQTFTFSSGSHTLRAWADAFDTVQETNDNNNTRDEDITISGLDDQAVPPSLPAGPQPTPTNTP